MKIQMTNNYKDSNMTSCLGYCKDGVTLEDLSVVFGEPIIVDADESDGKTKVEWIGKIEGKVFTIYDYKNSKPIDQLSGSDFHIGGKSKDVVALVNSLL